MKGRYAGGHMTIYGHILPGASLVARSALKAGNLTERGKQKLKIVDWCQRHGQNLSLTSRRFGIERLTLRTWIRRVKQFGPAGLNDRSHRPKRLRQPNTPWETVMAVANLRKQYPAWSKYKIQVMLLRNGIKASASTIGRILKRRGLIHHKVSAKRRRAALRPKARFPRGMRISRPGDLIQIDTKYIMLVGGYKFYQFTAIDVLTKLRVLRVYPSQSSRNGRHFLKTCFKGFPFKVAAVQTDNGAPFLKEFDRLCKELNLPHYFIYPRTPKQNTYVEISHGADKREFYQQGNGVRTYQEYPVMQDRILRWEKIWNEVRPHQALSYLTPRAYFQKWQTGRLPTRDTITLQT